MRKAIFITNARYPRSGAVSNYIQYLAEVFKALKYQVYVIGEKNTSVLNEQKDTKIYRNVKIEQCIPMKPVVLKKIALRLFYEQMLTFQLMRLGLNQNDLVIDYSMDERIYNVILQLRNKIHFKAICCPTEWFAPEDIEGDYQLYRKIFEELRPKMDLVFPISKKIQNFYQSKGCTTCLLPILADCSEYKYIEKEEGIYKIILPANGKMKDALGTMLFAVEDVMKKSEVEFEFHITGIPEDIVKNILGTERYNSVASKFVFHGWMDYSELVELYRGMHYLLLVRTESQMTLSNFPSKVPECLSYGIVPLMSDVGDCPRYYLSDGVDSMIIQDSSVENCSRIIQKAVEIPWQQYEKMSRAARDCAENRFDYRNWISTVKEAIDNL